MMRCLGRRTAAVGAFDKQLEMVVRWIASLLEFILDLEKRIVFFPARGNFWRWHLEHKIICLRGWPDGRGGFVKQARYQGWQR